MADLTSSAWVFCLYVRLRSNTFSNILLPSSSSLALKTLPILLSNFDIFHNFTGLKSSSRNRTMKYTVDESINLGTSYYWLYLSANFFGTIHGLLGVVHILRNQLRGWGGGGGGGFPNDYDSVILTQELCVKLITEGGGGGG